MDAMLHISTCLELASSPGHAQILSHSHPQATPRFYLTAMEKDQEKAWEHCCITGRKWQTQLV